MTHRLLRAIKYLFVLVKYRKIIDEKVINLFLESIKNNVSFLIKEKTETFDENNLQYLTRGSIIWVEFGFNIGHEFGGRHPALVLKNINKGEDIYVVPLDSGSLPETKRKTNGEPKDGYIEIPKFNNNKETVFGMQKMDRWCSVYRLRCISWILVDFSSTDAWMRSDYVEKIEEAVKKYHFNPLPRKILTKT